MNKLADQLKNYKGNSLKLCSNMSMIIMKLKKNYTFYNKKIQ